MKENLHWVEDCKSVLSRLEVWCAAAGGASGDGGGGGADGAGGERVTFPAAEKDRDTAPA